MSTNGALLTGLARLIRVKRMPSSEKRPTGSESGPRACHICERPLRGATTCPACGAKVSGRDAKLPGPAEPRSLGSYGQIKYHDR
jgi:hypothetical protein